MSSWPLGTVYGLLIRRTNLTVTIVATAIYQTAIPPLAGPCDKLGGSRMVFFDTLLRSTWNLDPNGHRNQLFRGDSFISVASYSL